MDKVNVALIGSFIIAGLSIIGSIFITWINRSYDYKKAQVMNNSYQKRDDQ